jgi:ubiquinone/menaquinone biosynthesis C-methylase UbiE
MGDARLLTNLLSDLTARSPRLKRSLWKAWYEVLASRYRQRDWTFMNYGYAPVPPGEMSLRLEASDEPERYPIQLYHHVAGGAPLRGKSVLEVGCGRGGGCAYLARYGQAGSVLGIDYSEPAISFCRRTHRAPAVSFLEGDAEALPCADHTFDVVLNVESSHCYGSMGAFLAEVRRVLKPGGSFLWADLRRSEQLEETRRLFVEAGFAVEREQFITANVLKALDLEADRRSEMIRRLVPRLLAGSFADFAGVPGTRVYESLRTGSVQYLSYSLRKPAAATLTANGARTGHKPRGCPAVSDVDTGHRAS